MATVTTTYSAEAALTITLSSLGASATFVAGRESTVVDNTSNKYDDSILYGNIRVGSPANVGQILVYVFAAPGDSATYPDVMDGTDSAETITSAGVGRGYLKLAAALDVDATTASRDYPFYVGSVAECFGGVMPPRWAVFVTHNTGAALDTAAASHFIEYQGIKFDIA